MAKQGKSGLGRGLSSLLGGSFDESHRKNYQEEKTEISEQDAASAPVIEREVVSAGENHISEPTLRPQAVNVSSSAPVAEEVTYTDPVEKTVVRDLIERAPGEVSIDQIHPNPHQPRTQFKQDLLEELADSIRREGLLQPLLVREDDHGYEIIAGERRWQACKLAGIKSVPVHIKSGDDDKVLEMALIENIQRSDLNAIEEAYAYKRLMERQKLTQAELAVVVSKGRSTIANALRLLELPETAQQLLYEGKITAGHARAILSVQSPEGKEKLTEKLKSENLSVREAENLARLLNGREALGNTVSKREPAPESFKKAARKFRRILGTNVRVKSTKGKNKIEIEFKDEEELERLVNYLSSQK